MPCQIDRTAPAVNSPKAANIDHTYASRPKPIGWPLSRTRLDRRSAISKKISLPVSAQEWAASASIEADDVMAAAIDLAIAMTKLARSAISTVNKLWSTCLGPCRLPLSRICPRHRHKSTISTPGDPEGLLAAQALLGLCQVPHRSLTVGASVLALHPADPAADHKEQYTRGSLDKARNHHWIRHARAWRRPWSRERSLCGHPGSAYSDDCAK